MREIAEAAFVALDKEPKIRSLPLPMLKAAATVIKPFNINLASLLLMFLAFAEGGGAVAEKYGTHQVAAFFKDRVAGDADD